MTRLEEAREFFIRDRYAMITTGITIEEVGEDYSKCMLLVEDKHLAANNQVMGGAIYTLADFCFAVASNDKDHFTMTSTSTISYVSQAKDKKLIGECRAIKNGRRVAYFETEIRDGLGNLVAVATTTGIHV